MKLKAKIFSREDLFHERRRLAQDGKVVVFTNGCFDILHRGHVEYLWRARRKGDALIVGLNADDSVRRLKGPERPLVPEEDRAIILASLIMVDYVSIFPEETPLELIRRLIPDVLVKGGDYRIADIVGREIVEAHGGRVETIPLVTGRSTSTLVQKILDSR